MNRKFSLFLVHLLFICVIGGNYFETIQTSQKNTQCSKTKLSSLSEHTEEFVDEIPYAYPRKIVEPFQTENLGDKGRFFVITTIFNPASYKSRYELYHKFVKYINESGAQLVTIECIFPSLNQTEFQVTTSENPLHIQLKSDFVYFMKESLINIAVSRLPSHAKWVSWLDADIFFHQKNWIQKTIEALQKYSVVQMFKTFELLGPGGKVLKRYKSCGHQKVEKNITTNHKVHCEPGVGLAMETDAFLRMGGLPDEIVGGADLLFFGYLINSTGYVVEQISGWYTNSEFKPTMLNTIIDIFPKLRSLSEAQSKEIFGYVPLRVGHYWHGSRARRSYSTRWRILINNNFNYLTDVKKRSDGLLELTGQYKVKGFPALQADLISYFKKRKDDDICYTCKV